MINQVSSDASLGFGVVLRLGLLASFLAAIASCDSAGGAPGRQTTESEVVALNVDSMVTIGGAAARGPDAMGLVVDAALLSDGIAVADGMSQEVRTFSADGRYRETFGRRGSGPGEHEGLSELDSFGDDVIATWDAAEHRVTIHWPTGAEVVRPALGSLALREPVFLGVFPDTSLVFRFPLRGFEGRMPGPITDSVPVVRFDREGTLLDTLLTSISPTAAFFNAGPIWGIERRILGGEDHGVITGDGSVAAGDGRILNWYDYGDAELRTVARISGGVATPQAIEAEREYRLDNLSTANVRVDGESILRLHQAAVNDLTASDTIPGFDALVGGPARIAWVRRYFLPSDSAATWVRVSPDGGSRWEIIIPLRETLLEADERRVLTTFTDSLGAPAVRIRFLSPHY